MPAIPHGADMYQVEERCYEQEKSRSLFQNV